MGEMAVPFLIVHLFVKCRNTVDAPDGFGLPRYIEYKYA